MADYDQIELLKKLLRDEVGSFCRANVQWKHSISQTIREIQQNKWNAVFFGGTLRSLLLSRLSQNEPGRPRDIDIVMQNTTVEELRRSFHPFVRRQTRFGGLHLKRVDWQFDVWPLKETFALKERGVEGPTFADLPATTFLNIESIAMEVWPQPGHPRQIYSANDEFFRAILDRVIEMNNERNPFPELCVVRTLVMAANLQWKVGPKLLLYLAEFGERMSGSDFETIQRKHYGRIQWSATLFQKAMAQVGLAIRSGCSGPIDLSLPRQLTFWPEDDIYHQRIRIRTLRRSR